jgi:hypothetical protein
MTHAGTPNASEISGNLRALNAFAGIPLSEIIGFRAPLVERFDPPAPQGHELYLRLEHDRGVAGERFLHRCCASLRSSLLFYQSVDPWSLSRAPPPTTFLLPSSSTSRLILLYNSPRSSFDFLPPQYWPYTLDAGIANNCLEQTDTCQGKVKLPGLWEIPMVCSNFFDVDCEKTLIFVHASPLPLLPLPTSCSTRPSSRILIRVST